MEEDTLYPLSNEDDMPKFFVQSLIGVAVIAIGAATFSTVMSITTKKPVAEELASRGRFLI